MMRWCPLHEHGLNNKDECQDCEYEQEQEEINATEATEDTVL